MKKFHIVLIVLFALFVLALGMVPTGIKWWIQKNSPELIGRQIEIDKLRINYFNGGLRVEGFTLYEENAIEEFIGFDEFEVNFGLFRLLKKQVVVSKVQLRGVRANILQNGDKFNFSDLIQRFTDSTAVKDDSLQLEEVAQSSFLDRYTLTVKNFRFVDGQLHYEDQEFQEQIGFEDINFVLPEFTIGDSSSTAQLELQFTDGGSLKTEVFLDMDADIFEVLVDIDSMSIEPANLFILRNDYYNIQDISGRLTQHIRIEGDPNHPLSATHSGMLEIEDFAIIDEWGSEFLSFKKLGLHFDTINWAEKVVQVDHLTIEAPQLLLEIREDGNTLGRLVDLPDSMALVEPPAESKGSDHEQLAIGQMAEDANAISEYTALLLHLDEYTYRIDSIILRDGIFRIKDNTLSKGFEFEVGQLQFKAEGLGGGAFSMNSQAVINRSGRMSLDVDKIPGNKLAFDITYDLKGLDLDDYSPYTIHFTGSPVARGKIEMHSEINIRDNDLASKNAIDFIDIDFGKKQQKGIYNLPVKFIVSILRNPAGHIELDIPVEGTIDDPEFSLGKEIGQALLNISFNIVASPVKFIAGLFKKDEKELSELDYEYLKHEVNKGKLKTLEDLKEILTVKNGINMKVVQCGDYQLALNKYAVFNAKALWYSNTLLPDENYALTMEDSLKISEISDDDSLFQSYINERVRDRELNLEEKSRVLIGEEKVRQGLDSLLEKRNMSIRHYFSKEGILTEDRVNVINADFDTLSIHFKRPFFKVDFVPPDEYFE